LSLTIRDAQYLSWKTYKKLEHFGQAMPASDSVSALVNKIQDIVQKIRALETSDKSAIGQLFSELLFTIFILAERHGINLEESFLSTIDEIILGSVS
jgi:hypothetical protein